VAETPPVDSAGNNAAERAAVAIVLADNHAAVAALLALEKQTVGRVTGPLRRSLSNIMRLLAGRYVLMFGGLDRAADPVQSTQLTAILVSELEHLRGYDPSEPLSQAVQSAHRAGVVYASRLLPTPVDPDTVEMDPEALRLVARAAPQIDEAVTAAQEFSRGVPVSTWNDVVQQVGKANLAAVGLDRVIALATSTAQNSSIQQVAADNGAQLLWVAEPDACLTCTALSGHLADPSVGEWFDEDATYGKTGSAPSVWPPGDILKGPPRHVNCRCILELWHDPAVAAGGPADTSLYNRPDVGATVDLPAALRREAKRSIVYGWSLPSESNRVRLDAADRLLKVGAGLPKSVEARGRAAVKVGKFDNRVHPSLRRAARQPK
jgi:hypothetical protein